MQLLRRASFLSPAVHPLLIFCGCCAIVHLICFVCITSGESCGLVSSLWIATWSIAGGSGSLPLLLTFLCIKFQDTNSMSVPTGNFKKLHGTFKQTPQKNTTTSLKEVDKKHRKKTDDRKSKAQKKVKKDNGDKLEKLKSSFLPSSSTTDVYSRISIDDDAGIKKQVIPTLIFRHSNFHSQMHNDSHNVTHFTSSNAKAKRKPTRQGKNTDEFPASSALLFGGNLMGNLLLSQNEEEVLRRKILARVDELDPLMCLPKVLCGYSSRRRRKNSSRFKTTTTTTTTHKPMIKESIIDEYLDLLGIVPPIPKEKVEENLKEADMYLKVKKYLKPTTYGKKSSNEKKKVGIRKNKKKHKKYVSEENDVEQQQNGSGSASDESYEKYPVRRPYSNRRPYSMHNNYKPYSNNIPYPYPSRHPYFIRQKQQRPVQMSYSIRRPYQSKFLFNRNKDSEEDDLDDDEEEDDIEGSEDELDELFDDEDIKYIVEKQKMEKLMASGSNSEENWWEPFDNPKVTMPYYYPPPDPSYDPLATTGNDLFSTDDTGGITGWFTNMFSNMMPKISWGGAKKDPDDIKSDPFFTSFDGRSLTNGESRFLPSSIRKLRLLTAPRVAKYGRKGKRIDVEKHFDIRLNSKQLEHIPGDNRDPAEKYRTAVEIGSRVSSPSQCDFIYNGCPLSYEEILAIINEPPKQKPMTTTTQPSTTTSTTSESTEGNTSFAHKFITPASPTLPPRQIVVPLQQQQQLPYQPPQTILLHQQQPQYHFMPPQQSSYQQHPLPMYNHPYQEHHHQSQYFLQSPQFQHQSALLSSIDGMTQVAKRRNQPHKTKIHQALPSGEFEIKLHFQPEKMGKSDPPEGNEEEISNDLNTEQDTKETFEEKPHADSAASTEHSQPTDSFTHKVLTYPNYEFSPSDSYKIRQKNGEMEDSDITKDIKVVSNTIKIGSTSSGSSLSTSDENNNLRVVSPSAPGKSKGTNINRRQQRVPTLVKYNSKGKGKYKRKQMFKNSDSSAPPLRHSSNQRIKPQQQTSQEKWKNRNENNLKIMRKKYGKGKNKEKKRKKEIEDDEDDNRSGNSSSNNNGVASTSASNEQHHFYRKKQPGTEYLDQNPTRRKRLRKKKKKKSHLHKQSSDSIEVKKRLKMEGPNAIYPIYGHPFPPPYAGYYHTLYPSTPTSPSFFSYFFGR